MKNAIKIILILIIMVVIIGITLAYSLFPKKGEEPKKQQARQQNQQEQPVRQLSQKESIEQRITETEGKGYERHLLEEGREKNIIVVYYGSDRMNKSLPSEKRKGPGILVFKIENGEIRKIWESIEEIYLTLPVIEIRDITGDGKVEIFALWSDGNKTDNLYIYSWTGSTFILISPLIESGMLPVFNADAGEILAKDLDGDKIEEIILIASKNVGYDETTLMFIKEYYRRIYKWNTEKQEYYPWKEESLGKEKPINIDGDGVPDVIGY